MPAAAGPGGWAEFRLIEGDNHGVIGLPCLHLGPAGRMADRCRAAG